MSLKNSGETASALASWTWIVFAFILGIIFDKFISPALHNWNFRRLLLSWPKSPQEGAPSQLVETFQGSLPGQEGTPSHSRLTNPDRASVQLNDYSMIIQDSPPCQEQTPSRSHPATHSPGSIAIQGRQSNDQDSRQSPPPLRVYKYDVFLSFRGPDVRNTFIDHLYKHLTEKGIFAFKDDKTLEAGEPFPQRLLEAVNDSRAAIVVFSAQYPTSFWCLEEMSRIAALHRKSQQIVIPVFYNIDPREVRNPRNAYKMCFDSLYTKFANHPDKVNRWMVDMTYLGYLNGHDIRNKPESTQIERIIVDVIDKLDHKFPWIANHLIGMQPRVEELERRLKLNSEDDKFRILGIWGMGGIGKTTHAKVLLNKIAYQFDASCFIEDISKFYGQGGGGATELQRIILQQTVKDQNLEIYRPDRIYRTVQSRLCNKNLPVKVLIVLDNVEEQYQWDKLAIDPYSLGRGSRVIMTTRNQDTLEKIADDIYEVPLLNNDDARQLFLKKAGKSSISKSGEYILEYAQSLPLAIEALGYFFNNLGEEYWEEALESMRKYPNEKIMNVLQKSFDELNPNEKEIFLHIACFFGGKREKYVKHILDSCGKSGHNHAIQRIMKKSLITIRNKEIHMHKMLQELGKDLVRRQFPDEPELWSRLWHHKDFAKVLMSKKETNKVKAIVLDPEENVSKFGKLRIEGLSKMNDLELLMLHHQKFSKKELHLLSNQLQYILWHGYPLSSIPLSTCRNLVELNLPNSKIQRLWKDSQEIGNLKRLNLSNSKNLTKTPDFKHCRGLVRIDFTGCTNLTKVHESIGLLTKLNYLSFQDCCSLTTLDLGTNCKLSSLRVLRLSGCTTLESTPNFAGLSNLKYLDLERCTRLTTVHESVGTLATLKSMSLRGCTNIAEIPMHINNVTSLLTLDLRGCIKLKNLPLEHKVVSSSCVEYFEFLDLGFFVRRRISNAIGELRSLEMLNLERSYYSYVTDTIERLWELAYLNLSFDMLHPAGRGILERYPFIIGQEYIFSAATKNALNASGTFMISKTIVVEVHTLHAFLPSLILLLPIVFFFH